MYEKIGIRKYWADTVIVQQAPPQISPFAKEKEKKLLEPT